MWNHPVGSKLIANIIWPIILALIPVIFIVYQSIYFSVPIEESWDIITTWFNNSILIFNWQLSIIAFFMLFIVINCNKRVVIKILKGFIKLISMILLSKYQRWKPYLFRSKIQA
jgi:hypothetical protein